MSCGMHRHSIIRWKTDNPIFPDESLGISPIATGRESFRTFYTTAKHGTHAKRTVLCFFGKGVFFSVGIYYLCKVW